MNLSTLTEKLEKIVHTTQQLVITIENSDSPAVKAINAKDPRTDPREPGQLSMLVMGLSNKLINEETEVFLRAAIEEGVSDIVVTSRILT